MARRSFNRWLREVSQVQLFVHAQAEIAQKYGLPANPPARKDLFWQRVYSPVYYVLPGAVRDKVVATMPGSHRKTWHWPAQASGPAASLARAAELARGDADQR